MRLMLKLFGIEAALADELVGVGATRRGHALEASDSEDVLLLLGEISGPARVRIDPVFQDGEIAGAPAMQMRATRIVRLDDRAERNLVFTSVQLPTGPRKFLSGVASDHVPRAGCDFSWLGEGGLGFMLSSNAAEAVGGCPGIGVQVRPVHYTRGATRSDCGLLYCDRLLPPSRVSTGDVSGLVAVDAGPCGVLQQLGCLIYPDNVAFEGICRTSEDYWGDGQGDWIMSKVIAREYSRRRFGGLWFIPVLHEGSALQVELDLRLRDVVDVLRRVGVSIY